MFNNFSFQPQASKYLLELSVFFFFPLISKLHKHPVGLEPTILTPPPFLLF